MRRLMAICALVLLAAADSHAARTVEGVVRAVYDGDTILLVTRESNRIKTRLYGVDAPETAKPDKPGQPFGEAARRALLTKVMGKRVSAEIVDIDQYQRAVAVIRYAGRDINREMVAEGMAWAYRLPAGALRLGIPGRRKPRPLPAGRTVARCQSPGALGIPPGTRRRPSASLTGRKQLPGLQISAGQGIRIRI